MRVLRARPLPCAASGGFLGRRLPVLTGKVCRIRFVQVSVYHVTEKGWEKVTGDDVGALSDAPPCALRLGSPVVSRELRHGG